MKLAKLALYAVVAGGLMALVVRVLERSEFATPGGDGTEYGVIDAYVESRRRQLNMPAISLGIVEGSEVVHLRGFGKRRPGGEAPGPRTSFFIGSLTKSITASAVMQLVEAGKVDLGAPVQRYIPWFQLADPAASALVTVRRLVNQTSGIPTIAGEIPLSDFDDEPGAT